MIRVALALFALLLAGCSTTQVQLPYAPTAAVSPVGAPSAGIAEVVDQRGEGADWLGAIRGGYGNPVKTLRTDRPVRDVVHQALRDALAARGLLAPAGSQRYDLRLIVHRLSTSRLVRLEADADFELQVLERGSGRAVYTDRVRVRQVEGGLIAFDTGIFASVEELRALANRTQNEALDQLLGKPGFLAAVRAAGAPRV